MGMMKFRQITLAVTALGVAVGAAETQTCRDASGRTTGTVTTNGSTTTCRDARGRTRGTKR